MFNIGRSDPKALTLKLWYAYSGLSIFVSAGSVIYPLLARLVFSKASFSKLIIDVRKINPGKVLITNWNGLPIFVRNRTYNQIKLAKAVKFITLKDKLARNDNLPSESLALDINRCVDKSNQNWLVIMATCPHLGCVPEVTNVGWFCSCHGSKFDISGRIIDGPSSLNMKVPKCSMKTYQLAIEP
ncbi:MAG: ubiquinol-cytochrome c reductase iron-sulfur subunit [Candidatus Hodgkinia cicadicola]